MESRTCPRPSVVVPRASQIRASKRNERRPPYFRYLITVLYLAAVLALRGLFDHPNPKEVQHDYHGHHPSFRSSLPCHLESFGIFTQIPYAHYTLQLVIFIMHTPRPPPNHNTNPTSSHTYIHTFSPYFFYNCLPLFLSKRKVYQYLTSPSFERAFCQLTSLCIAHRTRHVMHSIVC